MMDPSETGSGWDEAPEDLDPDPDEPTGRPKRHYSEDRILDAIGSDPPLPASPARRRVASIIAFLFIAIILTFLVWFIATHPTRQNPGGMMGAVTADQILATLPTM